MSTLAEIMDELADTVRNVTAQIDDVDIQVEPRMVLNPSPPCIDMYPADPSTDPEITAFGELDGAELINVRVRISTADHDSGQDLLLAFMDDEDPLSLAAALTDDPTLNGMGQVDYRGRSGYVVFPTLHHEGVLLGALWRIMVIKAHS